MNVIVKPDVPPKFKGDPAKLKQVITNLISNAIKFTQKGEITVEVALKSQKSDKWELLFMIKDTGIGISKQALDYIFEPFSQAETSTTRKFGGTGLGLSISRSIVEMMGGRIWVTSEEGKGSTFNFTVLLSKFDKEDFEVVQNQDWEETDIIKEQRDLVATSIQGGSEFEGIPKILVVEDNEINKTLFIEILKIKGFGCDVAVNGQEAVKACSEKDYDMIFMDCQMPVMDGYEATRKIRKLEGAKKHVPIIAMTAYAMKGDKEKCFEAGMDDYLSKPIDIRQVMAVIHKYLNSLDDKSSIGSSNL